MVYYRKYRPQSLEDLIGQDNIKSILLSALKANKLSHAYLFCGPRGTGKTSTARILAKMVNCVSKDTLPCNKCDSCISITDGSNLDLIEIDAASNRGIEDIRALRETIKLAPTASTKKVYIIDEVHMLTTEAFNALLKTLEEPPAHALFILATTDPQKVPTTILSRVTRLDFKLASIDDLKIALSKIVESEKLKINDEALTLVAKKAQGSFRDGVKILDQLASLENITVDEIEKSLMSSSNTQVINILKTLSEKNSAKSLEILNQCLDTGVSAKDLTINLLDSLRSLIFIKNGISEKALQEELGEENFNELKKLSVNFSMHSIVKTVNCLTNSLEQIRFSNIGSLPLEIAVVDSCLEELPVQKVEVIKVVKESNNQSSEELNLSDTKEDKAPATDDIVLPIATLTSSSSSSDMQKIAEKWNYLLETARAFNFSLEALLRSSKVSKVEEKTVYFEVPYAFHQRMIETPKSRTFLESILGDILERQVRVSTVLGQRPKKSDDISNIEVAADDEIIRIASEIFSSDTPN